MNLYIWEPYQSNRIRFLPFYILIFLVYVLHELETFSIIFLNNTNRNFVGNVSVLMYL